MLQLTSSVLFLKGRVYEAMDNRGLAADCYKQALRSDVHCYEAFEALVQHQMLSAQEGKHLSSELFISCQQYLLLTWLFDSEDRGSIFL
jgi:anaphase-promoting complex subunit 6